MRNSNSSMEEVRATMVSGLRDRAQRLVDESALAWDLGKGTVLMILAVPFLVLATGLGTALIDKDLYKAFTAEDGVAESLQALFYFAALVMTGMVGRRLWKSGSRSLGALYGVLFVGLFFLTGEEISWGQRIFGWGTPESFAEINKQEETNLHNIHGVGYAFKWLQMLVGAYGALLPLTLGWKALERFGAFPSWLIPHFSLIPYFVFMFVWKLYRNLFEAPQEYYFAIAKFNEVIELNLALGFFAFLAFQLRRSSRLLSAVPGHRVDGAAVSGLPDSKVRL